MAAAPALPTSPAQSLLFFQPPKQRNEAHLLCLGRRGRWIWVCRRGAERESVRPAAGQDSAHPRPFPSLWRGGGHTGDAAGQPGCLLRPCLPPPASALSLHSLPVHLPAPHPHGPHPSSSGPACSGPAPTHSSSRNPLSPSLFVQSPVPPDDDNRIKEPRSCHLTLVLSQPSRPQGHQLPQQS